MRSLALLLAFVVLGCATPNSAATTSALSNGAVASGTTIALVGVGSGDCVGIAGGSDASAALVQIQGCSGSPYQQWTATRDSAGYYALVNRGSGLCLDVKGAKQSDGTNIIQYRCTGGGNQRWNLADQGDGTVGVIAQHSGGALDVAGASTANGTRLVQWTWTGAANQRYRIVGDDGSVHGFAAIASHGLLTTTGGGSAAPVAIASCADLQRYLEDDSPRVLRVAGGVTLDCRTAPRPVQACQLACGSDAPGKVIWRVPVPGQTCDDLGGGPLVARTRNETIIHVASNKTLEGGPGGATLQGVSLDLGGQSNIIIRNLVISEVNPDLVEASDGITLDGSNHVWIDHCTFALISDGYFDIADSDAVTVSWNHVVGANPYPCGGKHPYVSLVESSQVTFDHDFFDGSMGRNPKVEGTSEVHVYASYYDDISYFCIDSGAGAEVRVEGDDFVDSRYPQWSEGGAIAASGDAYVGSSADASQRRDVGGSVFTPPYAYALPAASDVPAQVTAGAGPR